MKIERAIRIKQQLASRITSIYNSAKYTKPTSSELNAQVRAVKNTAPKGTPYWVISYLEGIVDVHQGILYKDHLEFCYNVNGKLYSILSDSDRYYEKHGITPRDLTEWQVVGGHYWKDTDRVYFTSDD